MKSLSSILEPSYKKYLNFWLKWNGFSSTLEAKSNGLSPKSYFHYLDLLERNSLASNMFLSEQEREDCKNTYKLLKPKIWNGILVYKYTNFYEQSNEHYIDNFFEITLKPRLANIDKIPMEHLGTLEYLVKKIDSRFDWIVLPREQSFVAEGIYDDLQEYGIPETMEDF